MERYLSIESHPKYEVSNLGHVRNSKTGRVLKPGVKPNGYHIVVLSDEGRQQTMLVHRLVADAFYDGNHEGLVVNHIDGNKANNSLPNLEWCTSGENNRHAYRTGLKRASKPFEQPTNRRVRIVETGETFGSIKECARHIGGNSRHISDCLNGKLNKHHGYNYEEVCSEDRHG